MIGGLLGGFNRFGQTGFGQGLSNNSGLLMALGGQMLNKYQNPLQPIFSPQATYVGMELDRGRREDRRASEEEKRKRNATRAFAKARLGWDDATIDQLDEAGMLGDAVMRGQLPGTPSPQDQAQYGLSPIYGTDAQGKPAIMQLGEHGQPLLTPLPEGFNIGPGFEKLDLGTEWGILDRNGQLLQRVPKDIAGAAQQEAVGASQGAAAAAVPKIEQTTDMMLGLIESIRNDPMKTRTTGWQANVPMLAGDPRRGFQSKVDQVRGQVFLQAFETLKGAGAITEREGAAATDAATRLSTALSDAEFDAALAELEAIVRTAADRMRQRAGQPAAGGGPQADPLGIR